MFKAMREVIQLIYPPRYSNLTISLTSIANERASAHLSSNSLPGGNSIIRMDCIIEKYGDVILTVGLIL